MVKLRKKKIRRYQLYVGKKLTSYSIMNPSYRQFIRNSASVESNSVSDRPQSATNDGSVKRTELLIMENREAIR